MALENNLDTFSDTRTLGEQDIRSIKNLPPGFKPKTFRLEQKYFEPKSWSKHTPPSHHWYRLNGCFSYTFIPSVEIVPTLGPYLRVVINECSFHIKRGKAGSLHQKLLIKHSNTEGTSINDVTPKGGEVVFTFVTLGIKV